MNKVKNPRKVTTELFLVLGVSAVLAVGCMLFLYSNRFGFYAWAVENGFGFDGRLEYMEWFLEQAQNYELKPDSIEPGYDDDYDKGNLPFLEENDNPYMWVGIYRKDTGTYVTGSFPKILDDPFWGSWLWSDADIFRASVASWTFEAQFKDCVADVILQTYGYMPVLAFYCFFGIAVCVLIVLIPVLCFAHRRMVYLGKIRSEILVMSEGDLEHPVSVKGTDEISALAEELNGLRLALKENIEKERQSHLANQGLIQAMSHDLRTPLTTLYGYLEILNHNKGDSANYPEYLGRCLKKTEEIRAMSDKMLEYSLVFDGNDQVKKQPMPLTELWEELDEQAEYLRVQGYEVDYVGMDWEKIKEETAEIGLMSNPFLLKRLVGNLFSNILRYGDRESAVCIRVSFEHGHVSVSMTNKICDQMQASGSGVGLRSAAQIALIHGGDLSWTEGEGDFRVDLRLPAE